MCRPEGAEGQIRAVAAASLGRSSHVQCTASLVFPCLAAIVQGTDAIGAALSGLLWLLCPRKCLVSHPFNRAPA